MFTGIVEEMGIVRAFEDRENLRELRIEAHTVHSHLAPGGSVAVDGVCLTATHIDEGILTFEVMQETLRATTLGSLRTGDAVNLERALRANGRLDGHIVLGHVDRQEALLRRVEEENYLELIFSLEDSILRYVAPKGSVAVNGVSLTVGRVEAGEFSVYIIPATATRTNLGGMPEGAAVNIEVDVMSRYIEALLKKD